MPFAVIVPCYGHCKEVWMWCGVVYDGSGVVDLSHRARVSAPSCARWKGWKSKGRRGCGAGVIRFGNCKDGAGRREPIPARRINLMILIVPALKCEPRAHLNTLKRVLALPSSFLLPPNRNHDPPISPSPHPPSPISQFILQTSKLSHFTLSACTSEGLKV